MKIIQRFIAFLAIGILVSLQAWAGVAVQSYDELISAIREVRHQSEARIEAVVEAEKVREVWETGKLIDQHILLQKERQKYGEQVQIRLAKDLGMDRSEITRMVEFARAYPIGVPSHQLAWSHYHALLAINDPKEREEVAQKAASEGWNRNRIREEVRKHKAKESLSFPNGSVGDLKLPEIKPGPLYTYQIVRLRDRLKLDLGFGVYQDLPEKDAKKFKEGDIVSITNHVPGTTKVKLRGPWNVDRGSLFTYNALVTQIVDGDTFHALIDLGFGTTLAQRVRLRRIDAPEILSAEGKEAKALLEKIIARNQGKVILQSRELDQHGRPIADVWVQGKSIDQELLDSGLVTVRGNE